jgi:hypothetical protein
MLTNTNINIMTRTETPLITSLSHRGSATKVKKRSTHKLGKQSGNTPSPSSQTSFFVTSPEQLNVNGHWHEKELFGKVLVVTTK